MSTISDYVSQKDEIERLNKQIDMIAGFYIKQAKGLESKLKSSIRLVKYYRDKNYNGREVSRTEKVIDMLTAGETNNKVMANSCHVSEKTVSVIKSRFKRDES